MKRADRRIQFMIGFMSRDEKAQRRGVSHITMHRSDWEDAGEPAGLRVHGKFIPIRPTGRKPRRWHYYYCRPIRTVAAWRERVER